MEVQGNRFRDAAQRAQEIAARHQAAVATVLAMQDRHTIACKRPAPCARGLRTEKACPARASRGNARMGTPGGKVEKRVDLTLLTRGRCPRRLRCRWQE